MKNQLPKLFLSLVMAGMAIVTNGQTEGKKIPLPEHVHLKKFKTPEAKTTNCGTDTIVYPYLKELVFAAPTDSFFVDAMVGNVRTASQAYHLDSPVSIKGIQFWGGAYSTSPAAQTLNVRAYLYSVDELNMPLEKLDSADLTVTGEYDFYEANFPNAHVYSENFAVAIKSIPNDTLAVITNNAGNTWTPSYGESLAWRRFGSGAWNSALTFFGQDLEYMIFPIVSYDLNTEFETDSSTVCEGTEVNFSNTSSAIFANRMFNLYAFDAYWGFAAADSSFTWNYDGINDISSYNGTYTFNDSQTVQLSGEILGYYTSCEESFNMDINVVHAPTASIELSGPTEFCQGESVVISAPSDLGFGYQWLAGGTAIENATADSLELSEAGEYQVIVSNSCGEDTSDIVTISLNPLPAQPEVTVSGVTTFCEGQSVILSTVPQEDYTYQWFLNNEFLSDLDSADLPVQSGGDYSLVAFNNCGADTSEVITITVHPLPEVPVIVQNGTVLAIDSSSLQPTVIIQWLLNGEIIPGANAASYTPIENGEYSVSLTDENTCFVESEIYEYTTVGIEDINVFSEVSIYPNPAADVINIVNAAPEELSFTIFNAYGQEMLSERQSVTANSYNVSGFAAGVYFLKLQNSEGSKVVRLVIK